MKNISRRGCWSKPRAISLFLILLGSLNLCGCRSDPDPVFCDLNAFPNPVSICPAGPPARTRLGWFCEAPVERVELRVGTEKGDLLAQGGPWGFTTTGKWVHQDMSFFLLDQDSSRLLATVLVRVTYESCSERPEG